MSMIRISTLVLITIFINIIKTGFTQDFTASISGKQNTIVLTPDDAGKSFARNDSVNTNSGFKCGESYVDFNGIKYKTVKFDGRCWLDRNLGAKRVAQYPGDKKGFGDYYQWGRLADGHENKASFPTILLSEVDNPGFAGFITTNTPPYDWHNPQNNNLWEKADNENLNPCPDGWEVASKSDFDDLISGNNSILDLFKLPLRIPATGYRDGTSGKIKEAGNKAMIWTSDSSGKKAVALEADNTQAKQKRFARANGMPVRCVKSE